MQINDSLINLRLAKRRERRTNIALSIGVVLVCAFILFTRFCWLVCVEVDGDSMCDTLSSGDLLLVDKLAIPERGDIIVFNHEGKDYIKRVIALGGDTVMMSGGSVFVKRAGENQFYQVSYGEKGETLLNFAKYPYAEKVEYKIDKGCYYVLGDNRKNSLDSRKFGSINKEGVLGVVSQWSIENRNTFWSKLYPYL